MKTLAVIGMSAGFSTELTLDRFDRRVFLGTPVSSASAPWSDRGNHVLAAVREMAEDTGLEILKLRVLVVCDDWDPASAKVLSESVASLSVVSSLTQGIALIRGWVAEDSNPVAVVGVSPQGAMAAGLPPHANISFGAEFAGYHEARGLAALLLTSADAAAAQGAIPYAFLAGISSKGQVSECCAAAMAQAWVTAAEVRYVEATAQADPVLSSLEAEGLVAGYASSKEATTAVGSLRSVTGEGSGFSQVAGLLKTVLVLHQRYVPGTTGWQRPASPVWEGSSFYFPGDARPMYPHRGQAYVAAYSCQTPEDYSHWIVVENRAQTSRPNGYLAASDLALVLLAADTGAELQLELKWLQTSIATASDHKSLATACYHRFLNRGGRLRLCLLAESREELAHEAHLAHTGVAHALEFQQDWKTPKGSYFAHEPFDGPENVTFVYPGIGATYVGLGREILHLFPEVYQTVAELADDIGRTLGDTVLNPRTLVRPDGHELKRRDHELRNNLPVIAECGVGFACLFTKVFQDVFDLKANFALGYSMGEISMFAALGSWDTPGAMSERLSGSDTFNHRLAGELRTLRQLWGLDVAETTKEKLWETYTIKATYAQVQAALEGETRVYCTLISTPDSLVIGGYPPDCQRVFKKLGVRALCLDMANAIHSSPAHGEFEEMERLFTMEVNHRLDTRIYSSSCYLPVPQRTKSIANGIAKCLCDPVDFPRLVNAVYEKGARVFVEMGPGSSLGTWIERILKPARGETSPARPHSTILVNSRGVGEELTIFRAVAKLVSSGVQLNLHKFFQGSIVTKAAIWKT